MLIYRFLNVLDSLLVGVFADVAGAFHRGASECLRCQGGNHGLLQIVSGFAVGGNGEVGGGEVPSDQSAEKRKKWEKWSYGGEVGWQGAADSVPLGA